MVAHHDKPGPCPRDGHIDEVAVSGEADRPCREIRGDGRRQDHHVPLVALELVGRVDGDLGHQVGQAPPQTVLQ